MFFLQKRKFEKLVSEQFPNAKKHPDLEKIRKLIMTILQLKPKSRPSMLEVNRELFLLTSLNKFFNEPTPEKIWKKKGIYFTYQHFFMFVK